MNSRFIFIETKVLQIWCKTFRDINKCSKNYRSHIKFLLWVHDLEDTYQKPINIDLVVDFLRNVNISWTTKFNNWAQLIRFVPNCSIRFVVWNFSCCFDWNIPPVFLISNFLYKFILILILIFFTNWFKLRYLSLGWFFVMIAFRMYLAKASWRKGR